MGRQYGHGMSQELLIILPRKLRPQAWAYRGPGLVIQNWRATGVAEMSEEAHRQQGRHLARSGYVRDENR